MFLSSLLSKKLEKRDSQAFSIKDIPGLQYIFGCGETSAGVDVTPQGSLSLSSVWSCVDIIARTMGSTSLPLYKRVKEKGKERDYNSPLWDLIQNNPNPEQTAYMWRHLMSVHQNLWGAGISEIEFDQRGQPVALWPIPPWRVQPQRTRDYSLVYRVTTMKGTEKILRSDQVVVFQSLTTCPDKFMSPICVHRETIGAALAVRDFGARTFGQGVNPAGTISGVTFGKEETQESLREKFSGYEGLGASHRVMLLEEGMKFERIGLPPEDAQYLETRKLDISEIARIYHVPLHLLQETTGSTSWGSGLEELNRGFGIFTMLPNFKQWEQELNKKLIYDNVHFVEFLMESLLRANFKDRVEGYSKLFMMGALNQDEIRAMENKNPLPDGLGEHYMVPLNMKELGSDDPEETNANTGGENE